MAEAPHTRRSTRQANTRKRSQYAEPDTDDDFSTASNSASADEFTPPKKVKITKAKAPLPRTRSKAPKSALTKTSPHTNPRRSHVRKAKAHAPVAAAPVIPSDGVCPAWSTLPYEILLQIFRYAYDADQSPNESASTPLWLLRAARKVCRSFAEPALTTFYDNPALSVPQHLHHFLELLEIPAPRRVFNYNAKIRRLELSARSLASAVNGKDPFDLGLLIPELPQLNEIVITHPRDRPPYRVQKTSRWTYPLSLFAALDQNSKQLKGWRWNVLLMEQGKKRQLTDACAFIGSVHSMPAFQSLQHLEIANFSNDARPSNTSGPLQPGDEEALASAIASLPKLKSLVVESSELLTAHFFEKLPRSLRSLRIANCTTLDSDILYNYLSGEGGSCQLRHLILDYNPRLDLAFLPTLKMTCPHLQELKMDLHYYSTHFTVEDAAPLYDYLLGSDEVPTWPTTLRTLELVHLQNWSTHGDAAQNLFRSLVDSAEELPDLRRLVLHAHINISWRDRAAFRDQWIERLRRVYQRYSEDPGPNLASLKAFRLWKDMQVPEPGSVPEGRRLSYVRITPRKPSAQPLEETSDSEPLAKRRSKRIAEKPSPPPPKEPEPIAPKMRRRRGRRNSDAISVASDDGEVAQPDWRSTPEKFVQGMCDIVDIKIDNQRPREQQFHESHFLDSEVSGDEEWTEGHEFGDDGYAW